MAIRMVGFDIGQREVKMAYTVKGKIKKLVSVPLPDNMVAEGGVIVSMDAMADFLYGAARENGIPRTNAAVILPESLVVTRNVKLPAMTAQQLKFNLPYEFKDYLPIEKEPYFFDYAMYAGAGNAGGMELFACAVPKRTVSDYRAMFRRAGFRLKVAIPEEWAYVSALRRGRPLGGTTCFVDLGHGSTQVHMLAEGRPAARRSIPFGIRQVEGSIAEEYHVDIHMARAYKKSDYEGVLGRACCCEVYERLAVEVLKTVHFYNYSNRDAEVKRICLCGGGAAIGPLAACMQNTTQLELVPLGRLLPELAGREVYLKAYGSAVSP